MTSNGHAELQLCRVHVELHLLVSISKQREKDESSTELQDCCAVMVQCAEGSLFRCGQF